ncbi:MAG: thioredoxin family protein [Bacteroidia bacterium]
MAVVVATDQDFNTQLAEHPLVVVKYYADWCGACKLFSPKFRKMSEDSRFAGVQFLDVNAETSPEARKAAGVNNLPFFATFKNGQLVKGDFTAKPETVEGMISELL